VAFIRIALIVMLLRGLMTINLSAKVLAINVIHILPCKFSTTLSFVEIYVITSKESYCLLGELKG
jgi:hypothetical protein